jgi:quinol monooxygenase YgiN
VANEPGCLRFDIIQDNADPNRFYFYEVYVDEAAFNAHLTQPHYLRWREEGKDFYVEPTSSVAARNVFPSDADWPRKAGGKQ